jgi:uncharacterized damage-inducible protein DinB
MPTTISESLLPEFDHEMANTRKVLERVADDHLPYQPHGKSRSLAQLAGHLAGIPVWATIGLTLDTFDLADVREPAVTTRMELLEIFDRNVATAREHLVTTDDAAMMRKWTLRNGGHVVLSMPKVAVLRSFAMNHLIHHRGQLTVYLRLNDVSVPSLYGPSADET